MSTSLSIEIKSHNVNNNLNGCLADNREQVREQ